MAEATGTVRGVSEDLEFVDDLAALREVLHRSREFGFLGPGEVDGHIEHARPFVELLASGGRVLDLGAGGGVPGLVVAAAASRLSVQRLLQLTLLDANARRIAFLRDSVRRLAAPVDVSVIEGRAEVLAHRDDLRGAFDTVIARSFAAPAVTAECATAFLAVGGRLLVSEPVDDLGRWPAAPLHELGLEPVERLTFEQSTVQTLVRIDADLTDVPRAVGVPTRRPRF